MLTSGMVPALYADDEKEQIVSAMRNEACKGGAILPKEQIWQYFVSKCAGNLHIVLAMSPVGDTLRTRCRNFPGLVNNASIDWFFPWPEQALYAVAGVFISPDVSSIDDYTLKRNIFAVKKSCGNDKTGDHTTDFFYQKNSKH
jgi:dynein heavy chain